MYKKAWTIITNAEYLATSANGRNVHRLNSLVTRIYLLCSADRIDEAEMVLEELYKLVHQEDHHYILVE